MTVGSSTRESQRVRELARQYRRDGYHVVHPAKPSDLPPFLRDTMYLPDLVATSEKGSFVIEVKSRDTVSSVDQLSAVSELVNAQPGWQFVLVVTNPRDSQLSVTNEGVERAELFLEKAKALGTEDEAHTQASFLFSWVALEASLHRLIAREQLHARVQKSGWSLIRDAAMAGQLDRRDAQRLEELAKIRSSLLHAGDAAMPTVEDVAMLQRVAEEVLLLAEGGTDAEG